MGGTEQAVVLRWSRIVFYTMIAIGVLAAGLNLKFWFTERLEPVPFLVRAFCIALVIFLVPLYGLLLSVGIRKSRGVAVHLTWTETLYIAAFVGMTLVPLMWIASESLVLSPRKHSDWSGIVGSVALIMIGVGWLVSSVVTKSPEGDALKSLIEWLLGLPAWLVAPVLGPPIHFHRQTMILPWQSDQWKGRLVPGAALEVRRKRAAVYSDEQLLGVFQESTLTPVQEPAEIAKMPQFRAFAKRLAKRHDHVRVLDVGGAEGVATRQLLNALSSLADSKLHFEITLSECSKQAEYSSNIQASKSYTAKVLVESGFSIDVAFGEFDLIICFHSLYSILDAFRGQPHVKKAQDLRHHLVAEHLAVDGLVVISLSSQHGSSAEFKRSAMTLVYGSTFQDATGDELVRQWRPVLNHRTVDSFFYFPTNQDGEVAMELIASWMRYFVRVPSDWATDELMRRLAEDLAPRLLAFVDLPEAAKEKIRDEQLVSEELLSRTRFLPHKTVNFLLEHDARGDA